MNPARSLGPAVCYSSRHSDSQVWRYHYIYWVGPTAGALVASILFRYNISRNVEEGGGGSGINIIKTSNTHILFKIIDSLPYSCFRFLFASGSRKQYRPHL